MNTNFYVYKFIGKNNEVLYVGQTVDLDRRMSEHKGTKWDMEKDHIEYAKCNNQVDMCLYEMYYINKLDARYNDCLVYHVIPTVELPELDFQIYDCKISEKIHNDVVDKSRQDFYANFSPENYWPRKKQELEDKIKDLKPSDEQYKEIADKIDMYNKK